MAISTYGVYLMKKGTGSPATYTKLVDIKEYPDLGGKPESLETTTLSDGQKTYIPGIQDTSELEFKANYTKADYTTLKALEGTENGYAVYFGHDSSGVPSGTDGKYVFNGKLSVYVNGGGVNEVVDMTITIMPSTEVTPGT